MLNTKPNWAKATSKCWVVGCDSYKERRWLLNPIRLFCRGWFRRHILKTSGAIIPPKWLCWG